MAKKLKISANSAFYFWVTEQKRKRGIGGIGGISRKSQLKTRERVQNNFLCNEIEYELI